MNRTLVAAIAVNIVVTIVVIVELAIYSKVLPPIIPLHYDEDGDPDTYGSKFTLIGIFAAIFFATNFFEWGLVFSIGRCVFQIK